MGSVLLVAAACAGLALALRPEAQPRGETPRDPAVVASQAPRSRWAAGPVAAVEPTPLPTPTPAEARLGRARQVLDSYLAWNTYPPDSRPLSRHPDMEKPHWVPRVTSPLAGRNGKAIAGRLRMWQDRRELVGEESALLGFQCIDSGESSEPCRLVSATAVPTQGGGSGYDSDQGVPVSFAAAPTEAAGTRVATVQPSALGFRGYFGVIQVHVVVEIDGEEGATSFSLVYTPSAPARFTGPTRERLDAGSLVIDLGLDVARSGRYRVLGRIVDATGRPFALVQLDQELEAGPQVASLRVFGKLVHDEHPAFPLTLRDVEGARFLAYQTPDRELMRALEGPVYSTGTYPLEVFADEAWTSEEKTRMVAIYEREIADNAADVAREKATGSR